MNDYEGGGVGTFIGGSIILILTLAVFVGGCGLISSTYKTGPTEVALVRNGGPLDDKSIDTVTPPSSNFQVPGFFQDVRKYIADNEQRYYTISSDPGKSDSGGADFVQVPTSDGVQVRLDATTYFNTAFTGLDDDELLQHFDTSFGNREFNVPGSDDTKHVWDGNDGWNAWLDTIFRPVLENTIREVIGEFKCAELISSCALIQQGAENEGQVDLTSVAQAGSENQENFEKVQNAIQTKFTQNILDTLGDDYLQNIQFRLVKVTLPEQVQNAIDDAQSSFAQIAQSRAEAAKAKFEARRLALLARQYEKSPALATLDAAKALAGSSNATIILGELGSGLNIGK